ncbi:hypothetical protein Scep_027762 [Stephania cephalantha]|uniref:Uncharacterized protein n=1 Tax=Stephania cephalantha TaxID=152367 RepID=A0AAP0HMU6_9MAGN
METTMRLSKNPRLSQLHQLHNCHSSPLCSFSDIMALLLLRTCPPSLSYIYAQLGYVREYVMRTSTAIDSCIDHQAIQLRRIEGHLLLPRQSRDDCASGSAR